MHLSLIRLLNFRRFGNSLVDLDQKLSIFVGANNSGVSDRHYGATDDRRIGAAFSGGFRLDPGRIIRPFRARPQPPFPTAVPAAA